MAKVKVCKRCEIRESLSKTIHGKGLDKKGFCPVCSGSVKNPTSKYLKGKWNKQGNTYYYEVADGLKAGVIKKQGNKYKAIFIGVWNQSFNTLREAKTAIEQAQKQSVLGVKNPSFTNKDFLTPARKLATLKGIAHKKYYDSVSKKLAKKYNISVSRAGRLLMEAKAELKPNFTEQDFREHKANKLRSFNNMFHGESFGIKKRFLESDYTPNNKAVLGRLALMKVQTKRNGVVPIHFDGESYLGADLRKNLWVSGKDARITNLGKLNLRKNANGLTYLGKLKQIDYVTGKRHIENGKTFNFFHKLGEVTKEVPSVWIDKDGFPLIIGGDYDILSDGIVN